MQYMIIIVIALMGPPPVMLKGKVKDAATCEIVSRVFEAKLLSKGLAHNRFKITCKPLGEPV